MEAKLHEFGERLAFSEGVVPGDGVMNAVIQMVPNALGVVRATEQQDRNGTDYWIERSHGLPPISLDMKNRSFCPIEKFGQDDACIETTSVYIGEDKQPWRDECRKKPGWTLDYRKRTDFIVYTWRLEEGMRFWIVPFVPLCAAARKSWRSWVKKYPEKRARNKDYLTLCVYPPRAVIARSIRDITSGFALDDEVRT